MPYQIQRAQLFYLLPQYATNIEVSPDCYSFMKSLSSYNSQLTPGYLLHTEKGGKIVWPLVFNMELPTSPLEKKTFLGKTSQLKLIKWWPRKTWPLMINIQAILGGQINLAKKLNIYKLLWNNWGRKSPTLVNSHQNLGLSKYYNPVVTTPISALSWNINESCHILLYHPAPVRDDKLYLWNLDSKGNWFGHHQFRLQKDLMLSNFQVFGETFSNRNWSGNIQFVVKDFFRWKITAML